MTQHRSSSLTPGQARALCRRRFLPSVSATGACFRTALQCSLIQAGCTDLSATREDVLIAHACVESGLSGLSRYPEMDPDIDAIGGFHVASLATGTSRWHHAGHYVDAVQAHFPRLGNHAKVGHRPVAKGRSGYAFANDLARKYCARNVTEVNVGISETIRGLLRRPPAQVIVNPFHPGHSRLIDVLATERAVPVIIDGSLPVAAAAV